MRDRLTIVVGGQAGSEGKGAVTARLMQEESYDMAVRIGGPNAGHTVVDQEGRRFAFRQLPVAAVADPHCDLIIAAGSEVDPDVLKEEIAEAEAAGYTVKDRLLVDEEATLLEPGHAQSEADIRTGTTGKGIGAARAARALRRARRVCERTVLLDGIVTGHTQSYVRDGLRAGYRVIIEGTQGFQLGSHAGYYPYCTSGDCKASDFLAAVGLPPTDATVWLVLRTYPIRIAGDSGPLPKETTWAEVGVEPEITTVTKKVRRVGQWNWEWAQEAVAAHRPLDGQPPVAVALTFADYWWPELKRVDGQVARDGLTTVLRQFVEELETRCPGSRVQMLGTGPNTQMLVKESL